MKLIKKLSSSYFLIVLLVVGTFLFSIISCQREIHCPDCNKKPIAIAGPDQTITLRINNVTLDGSSSKDPDGKIIGFLWRKISGSDTFNLRSPNTAQTNVNSLKKRNLPV